MGETAVLYDKTQTDTDIEQQLQVNGISIVNRARSLVVNNEEDYHTAAEYLRNVKNQMKAVEGYWFGPKSAAKQAHQQVCDREKMMLIPLKDAEAVLKGTMARYQTQVENERRRQEAELRRLQREEADRLLKEAVAASAQGDHSAAEATLTMAQMVEEMPAAVTAAPAPTAPGVSTRMVWKAVVTDEKAVPIEFGGIIIRPIDMSLLNQLARSSRGTAHIEGVEFYQEPQIAVR